MIPTSWILFDKHRFPMLQPSRTPCTSTNAVIYDRGWLRSACQQGGLVITNVEQPRIHGYHW
jgi:hypothetical protein